MLKVSVAGLYCGPVDDHGVAVADEWRRLPPRLVVEQPSVDPRWPLSADVYTPSVPTPGKNEQSDRIARRERLRRTLAVPARRWSRRSVWPTPGSTAIVGSFCLLVGNRRRQCPTPGRPPPAGCSPVHRLSSQLRRTSRRQAPRKQQRQSPQLVAPDEPRHHLVEQSCRPPVA